jgi:hypothetical protein
MTTRFSRALSAGIMMIALAVARDAAADPTAADVETARGLYVEGLELRDSGKLEMSLGRFKAAHALAATPITSLELGRAHALLGELVEAREVLSSIERLPVQPSESAKAANARVEARAMTEQLRDRIPAMRIVFSPEPPAPPHVTIDGVVIPPEALANPRKVNPGSHTIVAESNGARATSTVLLIERELRMVTLSLRGATAAVVKPVTTAPDPSRVTPDPSRESPPPSTTMSGPTGWFYVGLGAAGVGIIVGSITGAIALSKASTLESECTGSACPRTAADDLTTSRTMGVVSTVAFGIAAFGGAVAIVTWLTRPSSTTAVRTSPNALRWSW